MDQSSFEGISEQTFLEVHFGKVFQTPQNKWQKTWFWPDFI